MNTKSNASIRATVMSLLGERGVTQVADIEPLFSSGLLDSVAATEVLLALETDFGVDLSDEDFDITHIDTLASLEHFVASRTPA
ncbi:phosphopantetheine-binding protein [Rhizobium lemnae]|uniref:Phosphopantetheine-binding protein n=1 Tax=Rhizobium lemnae TaxID=1214924 RepID=A0ABV8EAX3_9HYPH|nr:phosphopantetheine-binding protein [Rhizobium lemnae]MCJ8509255.1 phosphopantetheine-binding protein [Rhizobium lemnae]